MSDLKHKCVLKKKNTHLMNQVTMAEMQNYAKEQTIVDWAR